MAFYREVVKYFAIIRLLRGDTARTVRSRVSGLVSFTRFLAENCGTPLISDCDARTAFKLKEYLAAGQRIAPNYGRIRRYSMQESVCVKFVCQKYEAGLQIYFGKDSGPAGCGVSERGNRTAYPLHLLAPVRNFGDED